MSELNEMKSLLAHIRSRRKLGEHAKADTYVKHVVALATASVPACPKHLSVFVRSLTEHPPHRLKTLVELTLRSLGWGSRPTVFDTWFMSQFGPPPFKSMDAQMRAKDEIQSLEMKLGELKRRVARQERYEEHQRAALYAWQAAPRPRSAAKGLAKARPRAREVH